MKTIPKPLNADAAELFVYLAATITRRPKLLLRVMAANADWRQGQWIRGWRRPTPYVLKRFAGFVTKGWVIRTHGRAAWEAIPREKRLRTGRRSFVARQTCWDHLPRTGLPDF